MKASWWKYALIALVSLGVIACGKDNKSNNGAYSNPMYNDGIQTPVQTTTFEQWKQQVLAGAFKSLPSNYEMVWGSKISYAWESGLFGIKSCQVSYESIERTYMSGAYTHELGTDSAAIINALKPIVNKANNYPYMVRESATRYKIYHNKFWYVIDTSLPLLANPISKVLDGGQANSSGCNGSGYQY